MPSNAARCSSCAPAATWTAPTALGIDALGQVTVVGYTGSGINRAFPRINDPERASQNRVPLQRV
jgi:hypothetical protein